MSARNQPCHCGSGKVYRKCCGREGKSLSCQVLLPDGRRQPVAQVFQGAMAMHQAGQIRRAAELYQRILKAAPRHADALHLLGLTERQLGRIQRAVQLIESAIAIQPRAAMFHSNLADALCAGGWSRKAEAASRRALELDPDMPEAHLNLGGALMQQQAFEAAVAAFSQANALRTGYIDALLGEGDALLYLGRYEEALQRYRDILVREPASIAALTRYGITLRKQGRVEEAIRHYENAIGNFPHIPELHNNLYILYQKVGRREDAATCLRRLLELKPEDNTARHLLAALEGKTTDRAPADYVREIFDGYAESFESHLVQKLGYRTPRLLDEALCAVSPARTCWDVLDLGCGTGLMGEVLADRSARLVGIDIAPKMIDKAREKGVYTDLAVADILPFLQESGTASYDLVVAADVFVYLGELAEIFTETRRLLRPGGVFLFSVEVLPDGEADFMLDHTGRYRHAAAYLHRLRELAGLEAAYFADTVLRHQSDQPVLGYLCVFRLASESP